MAPVIFSVVPEFSPLNAFEPYEIVGQTHRGFIYKSQITGQSAEITTNEKYKVAGGK